MKINPAKISTMALQNSNKPASTPRPNAPAAKRMQSEPLGDAQSKLNAMPEVDMARVDAVKTAISQGKIEVDLNALAEAMRRYHQR